MSLLNIIRAKLGQSNTDANNFTLTAEADNGTMKLARGNPGATSQDILTVDAAGNVGIPVALTVAASAVSKMFRETVQATASGTSKDFLGIPSWVKRITLLLDSVSTSGTSVYLVQLGTSGGIQTTGYSGTCANPGATTNASTGCPLTNNFVAAALLSGRVTVENITGNVWVMSGVVGGDATYGPSVSAVRVTLSGVLDRIRLTTTNGTDTFDNGQFNIIYEGF